MAYHSIQNRDRVVMHLAVAANKAALIEREVKSGRANYNSEIKFQIERVIGELQDALHAADSEPSI